jgi:hypothetical protein
MLILGEIRTSLLHNSAPLPRAAVFDLLSLRPGRRVLVTDRPINRSVSPDTLTGVDCRLATTPQAKARGIGTVATHAVVTGGLVVQSSARARLEPSPSSQRREWAYYTRRRGVVEVLGKADAGRLDAGYRANMFDTGVLDLGSISEHLMGQVQCRPQLDFQVAARTRPTRLRWSAVAEENADPRVHLHIDDDVTRTVRLTLPPGQLAMAERFCADLALHDWLVTALGHVVDYVDRAGAAGADPLAGLTTALGLLVKLWMPTAHVDPALHPLWDVLEKQPGFTRQWNAHVLWIRDQVALRTLQALERVPERDNR